MQSFNPIQLLFPENKTFILDLDLDMTYFPFFLKSGTDP